MAAMIGAGGVAACHNIADLRARARRRLPGPIFGHLEGAAEDEGTSRRNITSFDAAALLPRYLVDVDTVDTRTTILGQPIDWPVYLSPTGWSRFFHADGELAVARAAARAGTLYGLSSGSTYSIEQVAAASAGPKLFQPYIYKHRDHSWAVIERARAAGYKALCLTIDTPVVGKRERDLRSGMKLPPRWTLASLIGFAAHPRWVMSQAIKGQMQLANFTAQVGPGSIARQAALLGPFERSLTWRDLRDIADRWGGPMAVKGILSPDDARAAADHGATAVIVSNHGGRQLDGAAAAFEALPGIVRAVGDRVEVILDGGVRRGVHILKALAMGAKACTIGRAYLYGLAAGGERGVDRALDILRGELVGAMQLSGCRTLAEIDSSLLLNRPAA